MIGAGYDGSSSLNGQQSPVAYREREPVASDGDPNAFSEVLVGGQVQCLIVTRNGYAALGDPERLEVEAPLGHGREAGRVVDSGAELGVPSEKVRHLGGQIPLALIVGDEGGADGVLFQLTTDAAEQQKGDTCQREPA